MKITINQKGKKIQFDHIDCVVLAFVQSDDVRQVIYCDNSDKEQTYIANLFAMLAESQDSFVKKYPALPDHIEKIKGGRNVINQNKKEPR